MKPREPEPVSLFEARDRVAPPLLCYSWEKMGKKSSRLTAWGSGGKRPKYRAENQEPTSSPDGFVQGIYDVLTSALGRHPNSISTAVSGLRAMVWQCAGNCKIQKLGAMTQRKKERGG